MSRIPTWEELAGSGPRAARGAVSGNTGAEAIGAGIKQIGSALGSIGADITEKENIDDVLKADDYHLNARTDLVRSFDNDSDYGTFQPRARVGLDEITGTAAKMIRNPEMRKKWLQRATRENVSSIDQVTRLGDTLARQDAQANLGDVLDTYTSHYLNPDLDDNGRADVIRNMEARIAASEKAGLIRPLVAKQIREKYIGGALTKDVEQRMYDPDQVDQLLKDLQGSQSPDQSGASKPYKGAPFHPDVEGAIDGAAKETGFDPSILRTFAQIESGGKPNAKTGSYKGLFQLSNEEFYKYGGRGDIYNAQENAFVAAKKLKAESAQFQDIYGRPPTASELYMIHQQGTAGAAAHLDNPDAPAWQNMHSTAEGRQKGAGWAKQAIWGNIPDKDKARFGSVDNVTSQDFTDLWSDRVKRLAGDDGSSETKVADASGGTVSKEDIPPIGTSSRYAALPAKMREHLITRAKIAQSQIAQQAIKGDVDRIENGLDVQKDDQGRTALDRYKGILQPNVWNKLKDEVELAKLKDEAIRPLADLSTKPGEEGHSDFEGHMHSILPKPDMDNATYHMRDKAADAALQAWNTIEKMRNEDPAQAVSGFTDKKRSFPASREVAEAQTFVSKAPQLFVGSNPDAGTAAPVAEGQTPVGAMEHLFESRLAAQDRLGVSARRQKIITKEEAERLLELPKKWSDLSEDDLKTALSDAAERAYEQFGTKYGERAFREAVSFAHQNQDQREQASEIIAGLASGRMTVEDLGQHLFDKANRQTSWWDYFTSDEPDDTGAPEEPDTKNSLTGAVALNRQTAKGAPVRQSFEPWAGSGVPRGPADTSRPYISPARTMTETPSEPNAKQIDWLKKNPDQWKVFDAKFNTPGLAARILTEGK